MGQLGPLDWVVAGAAAVSLYVLVDMWIKERRGWAPAPAEDAGE
jgi:hypothetical protein